jgi:hypothetical protein
LLRERETGDYEFDLSISEDDAKKDVHIAERVLYAITTYVTQKKLIEPGA